MLAGLEKFHCNKKIQAKKDAEIAEQKRIQKLEIEKQKEAEKLAKAPIKKQLTVWIDSFSISESPIANNEIAKNIESKFNDFKNWAKKQTENI